MRIALYSLFFCASPGLATESFELSATNSQRFIKVFEETAGQMPFPVGVWHNNRLIVKDLSCSKGVGVRSGDNLCVGSVDNGVLLSIEGESADFLADSLERFRVWLEEPSLFEYSVTVECSDEEPCGYKARLSGGAAI